jgi:hypothetical protein
VVQIPVLIAGGIVLIGNDDHLKKERPVAYQTVMHFEIELSVLLSESVLSNGV